MSRWFVILEIVPACLSNNGTCDMTRDCFRLEALNEGYNNYRSSLSYFWYNALRNAGQSQRGKSPNSLSPPLLAKSQKCLKKFFFSSKDMFLAFGANFLVMSCIYNVDVVVTHLLCIYWSLPRLSLRVVFELKILPVLPLVCPSVFAACFNLNILRNPANTNNIVGFFFAIFYISLLSGTKWTMNSELGGVFRYS